MKKYIAGYVACLLVMAALDGVWLGLVALDFYTSAIGHLMRDKPNFVAAGLFYVFFVVGILIFAVAPALAGRTWTKAALLGGLFGFFAYMTYDLTNLATLKGWPVTISVIDMVWGTFITAVTATAGYFATAAVGQKT